jgi:hypothetical protein
MLQWCVGGLGDAYAELPQPLKIDTVLRIVLEVVEEVL